MNQILGAALGGLVGFWLGEMVAEKTHTEGRLAVKLIEIGATAAGAGAAYLLIPPPAPALPAASAGA